MPELEIVETSGATRVINLPPETDANKRFVSPEQWGKWSFEARVMFNALFDAMGENQDLFTHPDAAKIPPEHWLTVCWNAAWHAAENR